MVWCACCTRGMAKVGVHLVSCEALAVCDLSCVFVCSVQRST